MIGLFLLVAITTSNMWSYVLGLTGVVLTLFIYSAHIDAVNDNGWVTYTFRNWLLPVHVKVLTSRLRAPPLLGSLTWLEFIAEMLLLKTT